MSEDRRSSFVRAALAGSGLALLIDLLMLSAGHANLWQPTGLLGSFYDAQGRALLHGHLNVAASSVSFEGFLVGGKTYMYFGPVPALLRLPVLLITHGLDGRMTQLSMLIALVVLLVAGAFLHWRIREFLRPDAPVGRSERFAAFALSLALGTGVPLFLVSWPVVYHEAELWGATLAVASLEGICRVVARPTAGRIAWAGLLAVLAVNTRVAVGIGPIIALGLLTVAVAAGWVVAPSRGRAAAWLAVATLVAFGSAVALNEAKFHSAFGLPLTKQVDSQIDPHQRAYVAANHGALLGAQFVPTDVLAAVRPDAIGTVRAFPFIGLPESPPTVIGDVTFNALLPSLSAFTSLPLFCVLLLAGLPALIRRPGRGPVIGLMAATALGFVPALAFGSTATRYLADLLPFLWIGACAGFQSLLASPRALRWLSRPAARVGAFALLGGLALATLFINGSVGLVEQRLLAPTTAPAERASFVRTEDDIDRFLGRKPDGVHHGSVLPAGRLGPAGDLFVLGRCDGLYVQNLDGSWLAVERGERSGLHRLRVRFPASNRTGSTRQALMTLGRGPRRVTVVVRGRGRGRVAFSIQVGGRLAGAGLPVAVDPGRPQDLTLSIDPVNQAWFLSVDLPDGRTAAIGGVPYDRLAREFLGADPSNPKLARFSGSISPLPSPTPACDQIARRAGTL